MKLKNTGLAYQISDEQFKDIILCAFRYSLYRHTYALDETLEFIENHPELIDDRVKTVMLRDISDRLSDWEDGLWRMDKDRIKDFQGWLLKWRQYE